MKKLILPLIILTLLFIVERGWTQNLVLQLDGEDDYVEVLDDASLDITGPMTIELWYWFS